MLEFSSRNSHILLLRTTNCYYLYKRRSLLNEDSSVWHFSQIDLVTFRKQQQRLDSILLFTKIQKVSTFRYQTQKQDKNKLLTSMLSRITLLVVLLSLFTYITAQAQVKGGGSTLAGPVTVRFHQQTIHNSLFLHFSSYMFRIS